MKVKTKYAILEYIRPKSVFHTADRHEAQEIAQIETVLNYIEEFPVDDVSEDQEILDWLAFRGVKIEWLGNNIQVPVNEKSLLIQQIRSARKRAVSMGQHHGWQREFDVHPLAACMDNHTACIDAEMEQKKPDYLSILVWLHNMATSINRYCDKNRISGNVAAEYWLERFLWRCDTVCKFEFLN